MTTKEKLLTLFEKNKGVYFSRRCLHQRSPSGKSRRRSAGGLCAHRRFPDRRPRADRTEVLFSPGHRALYEPSSAPLPLSGAESEEIYRHGGRGGLQSHRISL